MGSSDWISDVCSSDLGFQEPAIAVACLYHAGGGACHSEPHQADRYDAHDVHVAVGGCARVVGVGHAVLHQPHGGRLKLPIGLFQRLGKLCQLLVLLRLCHLFRDDLEEELNGARSEEHTSELQSLMRNTY